MRTRLALPDRENVPDQFHAQSILRGFVFPAIWIQGPGNHASLYFANQDIAVDTKVDGLVMVGGQAYRILACASCSATAARLLMRLLA